ncbi:hypothetical protein PR202_gb27954 [Eleusine coracana subsp. coracana]|uniref:aldehyde oxygenase (deformylating) n=1 Tax=Eleusine coracana subsp. coracana TaxID=191504 RepID=A0AAV5FWL9_ELECO|nr:hypothetical protein QOZ80_6AG0545520 [Eleusine coracana subsp. coracana]GJN38875.1 hypothetical protein PR202_gb27954 [Eleusine coracana subsp. coracana]
MIPYATAAEAEAALGRAMTWAEAAWFRYSATMPDYLLSCHNALILLVIHTVMPLPFLLLEHLAPAVALRYKLQPRVRLSLATFLRCYRDSARVFLPVVGPFLLVAYPLLKITRVRMGLPLPSVAEILSQLVVYLLVEDYLNYWIHRLLHTKWAYNNIHHVHHEFTAPAGFTTTYAHWAEVVILAIPTYLGPAIVPCHITTHWLWFSIRLMEAIEIHCGYDFPFSPAKFIPLYGGAEYHDYHHYVGGQGHSNFASVFKYCDYIYGTNKGYRYHKANVAKVA